MADENPSQPLLNQQPQQPSEPVVPEAIPAPTTKPVAEPSAFDVREVPRIRTFADDIKSAVETDNVSMTQIAMAEQRRRDQFAVNEGVSVRNPKNIFFIFGGIALILISGVVIWYFLTQAPSGDVPDVVVSTQKTIIQYDNRVSLSALNENRAGLQNAVRQVLAQPLTPKSLTSISFTENDIPLEFNVWLSRIQSRIPADLSRSVRPTFLFGVYAHSYNSPFLLFEVSSFQEGFAGMLEWENDLAIDMDRLIYTRPEVTALTNEGTGDLSTNYSYVDKVLGNRDTRAYVDGQGNILFFYSFVTNNLVLVTRDTPTLQEVVRRVQKEGLVR